MTKRVWHLCSNRWNSAVTEYCLSAARSLQGSGWETLLTALEDKYCHKRAQSYGIPVSAVGSFKLASLLELRKIYKSFKPDVIMVYGGQETFLSKFFKGAKVIRFRGLDRDVQQPAKGLSYRLSQGHLAGLLAPSQTLADVYKDIEPKLAAVNLGVDGEKFSFQKEALKGQSRPTLTILGRLDPVKGHGAFFLWFSLLKQEWPEGMEKPLLKVIGEAANIPEDHIRGFAEDVGLVEGEDWEFITERVQNIAEHLSATHVGVICSQGSEVICRVAEEFLLCGAPIFVSGVGSLENCLYDDEAGFSYKDLPGDQAVKQLKELLLSSFKEASEDKEARALRSQAHFSFEAMGQSLDQFLT